MKKLAAERDVAAVLLLVTPARTVADVLLLLLGAELVHRAQMAGSGMAARWRAPWEPNATRRRRARRASCELARIG